MKKRIIAVICTLALAVIPLCTGETVQAEESVGTPILSKKTVTTNGNGGRTDVGAWYVTYNTASMWANNFGNGIPINYRVLMPDGSYGIPDSHDVEVIDFQLAQLAEAKIDFILFDLTNGGLTEKIPYGWEGNYWITETAQLTCERIKLWNENHDWKIKYAIAVGVYENLRQGLSIGEAAEYQSEGVWDLFYSKYGEDNYYQINGKPLMVLHDFGVENAAKIAAGWKYYVASSRTDHDSGERFAMRGSLSTPKEDTGFSWYTPTSGTIVTEEAVTVNPGQWNHSNDAPNKPRLDGSYYISDWKQVLESEITPDIVLISSFNDYNESTAVFTADSSKVNPSWDNPWVDDTGEYNNAMYWEITKEGIYELRKKNGDDFKNLENMVANNARSWLTEKKTSAGAFNNLFVTEEGTINLAVVLPIMMGTFVLVMAVAVMIVVITLRAQNKKEK